MSKVTMWRSRWRCLIKSAYSVSFLLSTNIFVWQNVLYFPNALRILREQFLSLAVNSWGNRYVPFRLVSLHAPSPLAARSKAWVCGCLLAGIVGSNFAGGMNVCCECCQVEVCATGWSLVQSSLKECGVSDREAAILKRPYTTRACRAMKKIITGLLISS